MTGPEQPSGAQQPPVVGYTPEQLEAAALPLEAAVTAALVAVAAAAARLITAPAGAPAGVAGAAFVTLDDLAVITRLWVQRTDRQLMPVLRNVFHESAAHVHDQIAKLLAGITELPPGVTELPAEPGVIPDTYAEDLMAAARNRLVGIGDVLWANARQQLADGMREGESIPQLAARVRAAAGVSEPRSVVIARTETISTSNGASIAQARSAGVPLVKQWIATDDNRTRPTHVIADNQIQPLGEPFIVGGAPLDFPGDPSGPPGEVIACRCSIGFHLGDGPLTAAARVPKLTGEALAEFNRKHARGPGGRFGSGGTGVVKQAVEVVKPRAAIRDVAKAKERLANAEKMFGKDRSKWRKRDRDLAERFDQFIAQAEGGAVENAAAKPKRANFPSSREAIRAFTGKFGQLSTDDVRFESGGPNTKEISGNLYDDSGNLVGEFIRKLRKERDGRIVAEHHLLEINHEFQGQGFAEAFNANAIEWYRKNGFDAVELNANIDVGGYAWARAGYDWADHNTARTMRVRINAVQKGASAFDDVPLAVWGHGIPRTSLIPESRRAEQLALLKEIHQRMDTKNFGAEDYPTPYEVSQLGRWPGAGKDDWWIGKLIMKGSSWDGVRKL